MEQYFIGIAEQKVAKAPDTIVTLGLGSCIGLILYDPVYKIGGMVHIMLPSAPRKSEPFNRLKFADTGVSELMKHMVRAGARSKNLKAKMAGGAHMFKSVGNLDTMSVGKRNIQMCRHLLDKYSIPLVSQDVGGNNGRSIKFCCESNMLQVRTVNPKSIRYI